MEVDAIELLKNYTKHKHIILTKDGDHAILSALKFYQKKQSATVLIPDQAGWLSYQKFPKKLSMQCIEIPTDLGVIRTDVLTRQIVETENASLIYQNPAGYFAGQPMEEIHSVCKCKCKIILDCTGSIGDPNLCDGRYADLIVGSFGKWKPVDLGYGGFISTNDSEHYQLLESIAGNTFEDRYIEPLRQRLQKVRDRLAHFYRTSAMIKSDLKGFRLVHPDKKGINVVALFNSESEKNSIIAYCEKHKYEYTLCPRYIRVLADAVSIEVKRLRWSESESQNR
jgi:dTDP-4-amino-4,6-dideoxygalactose transaminase